MVLFLALILILIANSAPILIRLFPILSRFDYPLDFHKCFIDHRPLLGKSKTWRGLIASVVFTAVCASWLGINWSVGASVGVLAMTGDSLSSFIKRRLGLPPSSMALGIDQVPESLLPLIYLHFQWQLGWWQVSLLVVCFIVLELAISRILYCLHIRNHPY